MLTLELDRIEALEAYRCIVVFFVFYHGSPLTVFIYSANLMVWGWCAFVLVLCFGSFQMSIKSNIMYLNKTWKKEPLYVLNNEYKTKVYVMQEENTNHMDNMSKINIHWQSIHMFHRENDIRSLTILQRILAQNKVCLVEFKPTSEVVENNFS